jgi:hypothetical protein
MKLKLVLGILVLGLCLAQQPPVNQQPTFVIGYSPSGSAAVLTITSPPNTAVYAKGLYAFFTCPSACTVTPEITSYPGSGTQVTPMPMRNRVDQSLMLAYTGATTAAPGTNLLQPILCAANIPCLIDLTNMRLDINYQYIQSLTLRCNNTTGVTNALMMWLETDQK